MTPRMLRKRDLLSFGHMEALAVLFLNELLLAKGFKLDSPERR